MINTGLCTLVLCFFCYETAFGIQGWNGCCVRVLQKDDKGVDKGLTDMKKLILRLYGVAAILFLFLTMYGILNLRVNIQREWEQTGYSYVGNFSRTTLEAKDAPTGEHIVLSWRLQDIKKDNNTLMFYTMHQNVKVYAGNERVYVLEGKGGLFVPKSPGRVHNRITLDESYNGREITIVLEPVYAGADTIPEILFGSRYAIVNYILNMNFVTMLLCGITIITGVIMIAAGFFGKGKLTEKRTMKYLGVFSLVIGVWKFFDSSIIGFFCAAVPVAAVIPFFALMILPFMATGFISSISLEKKTFIWDLPNLLTICVTVLLLVLQITGIADYWEMLWLIQVCLGFTCLCIVTGLAQMVKRYGWNRNVKMSATGAACCIIWMLVDMMSYYGTESQETFPFSTLVFLAFLGFLGFERIRQSREQMEVGMQARQYKKLAYHDALTGFFNRAAYMDYIAGNEFAPERSVMVAFDLNNLKKCNDTLGHEKGDIYIRESAKIIMDCFGEHGRCYRLGGDEFGAILSGATVRDCEMCCENMKKRVARFNEASGDIHMGIACGYAVFDPKEDEDIHATIRRADKMMYEEKFRMKQAKQ